MTVPKVAGNQGKTFKLMYKGSGHPTNPIPCHSIPYRFTREIDKLAVNRRRNLMLYE